MQLLLHAKCVQPESGQVVEASANRVQPERGRMHLGQPLGLYVNRVKAEGGRVKLGQPLFLHAKCAQPESGQVVEAYANRVQPESGRVKLGHPPAKSVYSESRRVVGQPDANGVEPEHILKHFIVRLGIVECES